MGTKNQPMFPNGVIYKGTADETPQYFRGESGANDSIIPTCDNALGIFSSMPSNPLTDILKDFRTYRPLSHNQWLSWVEQTEKIVGVREFSMKDTASAALYMACLDQVREFRDRHWRFTKQYILKHTRHPVATGGSPIATWLPNQLATVLDTMGEVYQELESRSLTGKVEIFDARLEGEEFLRKDSESVEIQDLVRECGERAAVEVSSIFTKKRRILAQEVEDISRDMGKSAVEAESKFA